MNDARMRELDSVLADYVERYGLTEKARRYYWKQAADARDDAFIRSESIGIED